MDLTDPAAFARMYDQHSASVYGAAMRILGDPARAQDVVQDVFLRVWRRPERFDARRGELGAYLRLMARSRALDLWREGQAAGRARDRLELVVAHEEQVRRDDRPAAIAEREEDRDVVREALGRLPRSQREAIVLAYWGGLTADEIARRAGVPLGTAKSRLRLGLGKLRADIDGRLGDRADRTLAAVA
jgi:RNA polymerase sigma-70 factor (ECF subfamily)